MAGPRRASPGPVRIIKADVVGNGHVPRHRRGRRRRSFKAVAFRAADSALGQALLAAAPHRRLWLAGRAKIDDWGSRPAAELHLEDAAWAVDEKRLDRRRRLP